MKQGEGNSVEDKKTALLLKYRLADSMQVCLFSFVNFQLLLATFCLPCLLQIVDRI